MGPVNLKDAPRQLPNALLYLGALLRPQRITPDLRVKNIAYVDWPGLRRRGYNAVVIDKDNCLTRPDHDELHPSLKASWSHLKRSFGTGRVLVVSNSSGTTKDHGGLGAEALSRQLGVPVLLHQRKKPGCGSDILDYFSGALKIVTSSHTPLSPKLELKGIDDVDMLIPSPKLKQRRIPAVTPEPVNATTEVVTKPTSEEPLNILVVGDRQFTDSLLAHRLSLHFQKPDAIATPRVLSIHTTLLFDHNDVRLLRWLENTLSSGIKRSQIDWGRYILSQEYGTAPVDTQGVSTHLSWWGKTKATMSRLVAAGRWVASSVQRLVAAVRKQPSAGSTSDLPPNSLPLDVPVDTSRLARILTRIKSRLPGARVVTRE